VTTFITLASVAATIALVALLATIFAPDWTAALRLKLVEHRYFRFRNLRHRLRGWKQELMLAAGIGVIATLSATVYRADGRVEHLGVLSHRVVTTAGVQFLKNCFLNTEEAENMNWHAMGTGSTAEAVGDTALQTEVESRVSGTQSSGGTGIYRTVATITATAPRDVREHGLFDASSGGDLMDRSVFASVNLGTNDSIQFTYDLTFTAGG
jgi:hypothetical protein